MKPIQEFQRKLAAEYVHTVGYSATYLHGNPVLPVIPVVTNPGHVMIIGAYPTARFATLGKERDVPVADIDAPFSNQTYFDGATVRKVKAGWELQEKYLTALGLDEKKLWLTNLVKVFLFKEGHVEKYVRLGRPVFESRTRFEAFAEKSLGFIKQEIALAQPKVVILLGEEVSKLLVEVKGPGQRLFDGKPHELKIMETTAKVFCLPHPGIVMRPKRKEDLGKPSAMDWNKKLEALLPEIKKSIQPDI